MEKITLAYISEFISKNNIPFNPSHKRLCLPIINRICQKMSNGLKFDDIKIFENLVLDGHHRYISAQITKFAIGSVPSNKTSATAECTWEEVVFDENDWDTLSKIQHLNERDAQFNQIDIEAINQMIEGLE